MVEDDLRILLVEDHPFQLRANQCLLESFGFTQLTAIDSAEGAMQLLLSATRPFDLLLCDQCLPGFTGLDLLHFASHHRMIRKAIILSSLSDNELEEIKAMACRHDLPLLGYITKPLKQPELRHLLTLKTQ